MAPFLWGSSVSTAKGRAHTCTCTHARPVPSYFGFFPCPPCQVCRVGLLEWHDLDPRILRPRGRLPPATGAVFCYGSFCGVGQGRRASRCRCPPCGGGVVDCGACRRRCPPCGGRDRGSRSRRHRRPCGGRCSCSGRPRGGRCIYYHRPRGPLVSPWGVYCVTRSAMAAADRPPRGFLWR